MGVRDALAAARLYGILDLGYTAREEAARVTCSLLEGGVQVLQLRAKALPAAEFLALARDLAPLCRAAGVPFVLNDHPELVGAAGADGAHIGQDDGSLAEARRLAGPEALIGRSTHSPDQARAAAAEGADYLGFGPLFATPTKPDYRPIGTADIAAVHAEIALPIFCIGGIKAENLAAVLAAGARRVVIVSGLLLADNIAGYAAACRRMLDA
jgi:thiamine-phosphate pyrophosphorylase